MPGLFQSPACTAAMHDMAEAGVNTSYLYYEEAILAYAGVTGKPQYHWLKGLHQGAAFEKAYKHIQP